MLNSKTTLQKVQKAQNSYINKNCETIQHEDNYQLLNLLLPATLFSDGCFKSSVANKPKLIIQVINKFKYTTELAFKYSFDFGSSEEIVIKLYHDAKVAELVYCTDLQKFIRLLGPKISPKIHSKTRGSLNVFLNKWLNFLLQNNYNNTHWSRLRK